jgi:hypothetical protein
VSMDGDGSIGTSRLAHRRGHLFPRSPRQMRKISGRTGGLL